MNNFAYLATGSMIRLMQSLSRARVIIHNEKHIPGDSIVFVVNHFTRIETLLLPYHIYNLTALPVWSLADYSFFEGPFSGFLENVGAVSTRNPDRDRLMVKSLLTREANWIIYPEGCMVKHKNNALDRPFFFPSSKGVRPHAHSGAAALALRTEFYRQRLIRLVERGDPEAARLQGLFKINDLRPVLAGKTWIVPVNITYYPVRARENLLSRLAERYIDNISEQLREEFLTEGTMLFSGVDIDINFGQPIDVRQSLTQAIIERDMFSASPINLDDTLPSSQQMRREAGHLMRQYMADIYRMTTVNHDHLFASLLKARLFSDISEDDFRRRVFLLASRELRKTDVFRHHSMESSQVALLTDDRYGKYREFAELARETGVVQLDGGQLTKTDTKFSSHLHLHRARIDNPLAVIANEMAPLSALQQRVRKIAWLPDIVIRYQVARLLFRQANQEFLGDYRTFYQPGESKERNVGAPLLLRGKTRNLGVVLVHGFLAAPLEMAELAEYLNGKGLWVYVVRLKGHGTSPEDLAIRTGREWLESVDGGYALMSAICRRVVIGGFSFGAGLALDCAIRVKKAAGVFAVCPPLRLLDISSRLVPAVTVWNKLMDLIACQGEKKEFVEIAVEHPHINYQRLPVAGVRELQLFMRRLKPKLADLKAPVLVVQAEGDPVVDPAGTRLLYEKLGSKDKQYRSFDFKRHGILCGAGAQRVHEVIGEFIDTLRQMKK